MPCNLNAVYFVILFQLMFLNKIEYVIPSMSNFINNAIRNSDSW